MKSEASVFELSARPVEALSQRALAAALIELAKPRLNAMVVVTTVAGAYLAPGARISSHLLFAATIGTALTAAGASTFNQLLERRYDALMNRTANRPLPSDRVTPAQAMAFGIGLTALGVGFLAIVNPITLLLGVVTFCSYVFLYTPLKRQTPLCTLVGAIPGAMPPVMGFTAAAGVISPGAMSLFAILFVWQIPHFLAIAILCREDYTRAGFKMLPVVDPSLVRTSQWIVISLAVLLPLSFLPAAIGICGRVYLLGAMPAGLILLWFGVICAGQSTRSHARKLFFATIIYLPVLLMLMLVK